MTSIRLPIHDVEEALKAALRDHRRAILTAPTGSGKTTQAPQMVHAVSRSWMPDGEVVVLQPRRLATRLVASRVAHLMNSPLGGRVGFQTRRESAVSKDTRIRFMTDGLFLRLLQDGSQTSRFAAVILDEFHERSLAIDLSLGLLLAEQKRRAELRVLVMSATLDVESLQPRLDCPVIRAGGRTYPVEIEYLDRPSVEPAWDLAAQSVAELLRRGVEGHGLVFMPGAAEINRTIERLQTVTGPGVMVTPLHGSLSPREQDAAVSPDPQGRRRIIVSTNVAETSITIDGIGFVVDSGTARIHRFDPRRGLNALHIEPISQASADQRAGRAGRTGPGRCVRLWTAKDHAQREAQTPPEVLRLDLSEALLTLKSMNFEAASFAWPTAPPEERLRAALDLLKGLGAFHESTGLTNLGRWMAAVPAHPRLARMLSEASSRGDGDRAAVWAAIIAERDLLTRDDAAAKHLDPRRLPSDLAVREQLLEEGRRANFDAHRCERLGINAAAARDIDHAARQFQRVLQRHPATSPLNNAAPSVDGDALHLALLAAFPDHVAQKPDTGKPTCLMPGRRRVVLDRASVVGNSGFLVALDVQERHRAVGVNYRGPRRGGERESTEIVLGMAARIDPAWIKALFPACCESFRNLRYDAETGAVVESEEVRYRPPLLPEDSDGADFLVLEATHRPCPPNRADEAAAILLERIESGDLRLEQWNDAVEEWISRTRCVAMWYPERGLVTYTDDDRHILILEIIAGCTRASQLRDRPCLDTVRGALSWDDQQFVEKMAPTRLPLPESTRPLRLHYTAPIDTAGDSTGPVVKGSARIQDLYGLARTPTVGGGRIPITIEILAPNHRPVQVTQDLAGFWSTLYPEVRKELKRRYPKHEWRESP